MGMFSEGLGVHTTSKPKTEVEKAKETLRESDFPRQSTKDVCRVLGIDPEELGKEILAHARESGAELERMLKKE